MPSFSSIPIMPKELKPSSAQHIPSGAFPYSTASTSAQRNAAIWSAADDEVLLHARASGLNWQPIASRHFPNKTANACRKRHERLIERRHIEDWDARKLETLAQEYMACRQQMWEVLAARVGERWALVEAKCMEKGLKTLQSTARTAQRRASAASHAHHSLEDRGISDHNSDSGIGLGSDTEMEVGDDYPLAHTKSASWHAHPNAQQQADVPPEHTRSRSLPQPLPLYQPPPPLNRSRQNTRECPIATSPQTITFARKTANIERYSPDSSRGGYSIQSVLST